MAGQKKHISGQTLETMTPFENNRVVREWQTVVVFPLIVSNIFHQFPFTKKAMKTNILSQLEKLWYVWAEWTCHFIAEFDGRRTLKRKINHQKLLLWAIN